ATKPPTTRNGSIFASIGKRRRILDGALRRRRPDNGGRKKKLSLGRLLNPKRQLPRPLSGHPSPLPNLKQWWPPPSSGGPNRFLNWSRLPNLNLNPIWTLNLSR